MSTVLIQFRLVSLSTPILEENFWDKWFLWTRFPYCHTTNSVKSLKETKSTDKKLLLQHNQTFLPWRFGLCQRPSSEEGCLVCLPVLATTEMWLGKKSVIRVIRRVAALVPVEGSSSWTRASTCGATCTTDFLQHRVSVVTRTRRRTEQASSDAGLW